MSKPSVTKSALIASAVAVAAAGVLAGCGGGARAHAGAAAARGRPQPARKVVVAISSPRPGHSLPAAFVGLAMEDWTLTKNQFAHTNLRRYLLTLGPRGLLRIGGNSQDRSFWTSRHERPPRWSNGTATPA